MNPLMAKLQLITALIAQRSEVIVIFVVIGIIFMMILPLPTGLVDALIALNISVSALMVVMVMYMPGPLAFSTFPALLLVTTLFRLGLSITTTRLILLQGDAGNIVEAFGSFVVGGNLVVGMVIFLILTLVNFLVITKGSERVAEVSARFTLDAMPGKQMSIDSDLRAGLLDAASAQKKRADIGRESQLFGAMDGAMKFVKGDAIAGIIIVLVNIIGGLSIGVTQQGLSAGEALEVYSILTIGDGLVAQIPALLISLTAGMIITRVSDASADVTNIGQDMATQLSSEPKAWMIAAFVMLGFSAIPGMPSFAFILFALFFGACGAMQMYLRKSRSRLFASAEESPEDVAKQHAQQQLALQNGEGDLKAFLPYETLCLITHPNAKASQAHELTLKAIRRARNNMVTEKGYTLPSIELIEDPSLSEEDFHIAVYGVTKLKGSLCQSRLAVETDDMNEEALEHFSSACERGDELRTESHIFWLETHCADELEAQSIPYLSSAAFISKRVNELLRRESHQFIGLEETIKIMGWINAEFPALAQELQRNIPMTTLTEILRHLAMENISIRSVRKVAEVIAEKSTQTNNTDNLIEAVRLGLRDQICDELAENNTLNICMLSQDWEDRLKRAIRRSNTGEVLSLSESDNKALVTAINRETKKHSNTALVVTNDIRQVLRERLKYELFNLPVLSYDELAKNINIVPIARINA